MPKKIPSFSGDFLRAQSEPVKVLQSCYSFDVTLLLACDMKIKRSYKEITALLSLSISFPDTSKTEVGAAAVRICVAEAAKIDPTVALVEGEGAPAKQTERLRR
jgi:hypothetical protein